MTVKDTEALRDLEKITNEMYVKLFGNGTVNGCIDNRLENVETYITELKEIMPKMVTEDSCIKRHEVKWSRIVLIIGLSGTWIGLFLKVMEVL